MKGGLNPWIWFDVMGMILTTTSPSEHTWLGILATVQSTGRRLNLHTGWTYRPPWRLALNLHYCGYLRFHFYDADHVSPKWFTNLLPGWWQKNVTKAITEHMFIVYPHFVILCLLCMLSIDYVLILYHMLCCKCFLFKLLAKLQH